MKMLAKRERILHFLCNMQKQLLALKGIKNVTQKKSQDSSI